jgi:hypothetical protein
MSQILIGQVNVDDRNLGHVLVDWPIALQRFRVHGNDVV